MMMELLYISIGAALVFMVISVSNMLWGPVLGKTGKPIRRPHVSLLVPARNEEGNIEKCLDHLIRQDYPDFEIIVLNDESTDKTEEILRKYQNRVTAPKITVLIGGALPAGWTGKNWACWQLAQAAKGEIIIFTDADNWHHPAAVSKTISWMEKYNLNAFSAFPQQITVSWFEKLLIPVIDVILYTLLPLWMILKTKNPSLSAANGQWLACRKTDYFQIGGHEQVKNKVVEDVEIFRLFKRKGRKALTSIGTGVVFCRMYRSYPEVVNGLMKIFYGLTGNHLIVYFFLLTMMFLVYVLPWIAIFFVKEWIPVLLSLVIPFAYRFIMKTRLKQNVFGVILQPAAVTFSFFIAIRSYFSIKLGKIIWKGRRIHAAQ
jgi:chlorobactene glucosyltransferase